jgi:hypothetical protein
MEVENKNEEPIIYKINIECNGSSGKEIMKVSANGITLVDDLLLPKKLTKLEYLLDKELESLVITYKNGDELFPDKVSCICMKKITYNDENLMPKIKKKSKVLNRDRLNRGAYLAGGDYTYNA